MKNNEIFVIRRNGRPRTVAPTKMFGWLLSIVGATVPGRPQRPFHRIGVLFCLLVTAFLFTCEQVPDYCAKGVWYNPDYEFCFGKEKHSLCNGRKFNPQTQGCDPDRNAVGTLCANNTFVPPGTPCNGYALSTASAPADGGDITITRTSPGPNFAAGEQVTLVAQHKSGYEFAGWAGAQPSSNAAVTLVMDDNKPMVAMFKPNTPTLATTPFPPAGGEITATPNADGIQVTVTASPADGHTFTKWEGASTSTNATITVTVDEGKTLVAMFTPATYTLTVNTNPRASGTIFVNNTASSGTTRHDAGERVDVLARAADGYEFTGWSVASVSTEEEIAITMDGNKTLTANFQASTHTHIWGDWMTVTQATCISTGTRTRSCQCGDSQTETIPMLTGVQCGGDIEFGTLYDERDGQSYPTVTIGTQTWMAKNLNFNASGSVCYGEGGQVYDYGSGTWITLSSSEVQANCNIYGRLYNWDAAMSACPPSWHLPTDAEWEILVKYVDPNASGDWDNVAGIVLKSEPPDWDGTNERGFSALPGGYSSTGGSFYNAGSVGSWWGATERGASGAWNLSMLSGYESVSMLSGNEAISRSRSVLCLQDD